MSQKELLEQITIYLTNCYQSDWLEYNKKIIQILHSLIEEYESLYWPL